MFICQNPLTSPTVEIIDCGTWKILKFFRTCHESLTSHQIDMSDYSLTAVPSEVFQFVNLTNMDLSTNQVPSLWIFVGIRGYSWTFMDICRYLWAFVDIYGYL